MGAEDGDEERFANGVMGILSLPGVHSKRVLLRVAAVLVATPIALLLAEPVDVPETWELHPMSPHEWDPQSANRYTLLLVHQDEHWNPAMPLPTMQRPPTQRFTMEHLEGLMDNILGRPEAALPPLWTYFPVYGVAPTGYNMEPLCTSDVLATQNADNVIPDAVVRAVLTYGWQLTWKHNADPTSIHCPRVGMRKQLFILPPLDARNPEHVRYHVAEFLIRFLRDAGGGYNVERLIVIVPVLDTVSFTVAVLTPGNMGVYRTATGDDNGQSSVHLSLQAAWNALLPNMWTRLTTVADRRTAAERCFFEQKQHSSIVPFSVTVRRRFQSSHPKIEALALYYALVAAVRDTAFTDPEPYLVCQLLIRFAFCVACDRVSPARFNAHFVVISCYQVL